MAWGVRAPRQVRDEWAKADVTSMRSVMGSPWASGADERDREW